MNNWAMILLGWVIVFAALAAYAGRVLVKGRALARSVADPDKPWT